MAESNNEKTRKVDFDFIKRNWFLEKGYGVKIAFIPPQVIRLLQLENGI